MMNRTVHALEFSNRIAKQTNREAAGSELASLTEDFGYTSFVLVSFKNAEAALSPIVLATSWAREWQTRYKQQNYILDDPVVARARTATAPFHWREVRKHGRITPRGEQILAEARSFDMPDGIFVPIFGRRGLAGALALGGRVAKTKQSEMKALHLAGIYAFERFLNLADEKPSERSDLTCRELECLHWTAAGKTSAEIADRLGISRHTADWYLKEAARKLNALNRTHAVVIAYRKGLIA